MHLNILAIKHLFFLKSFRESRKLSFLYKFIHEWVSFLSIAEAKIPQCAWCPVRSMYHTMYFKGNKNVELKIVTIQQIHFLKNPSPFFFFLKKKPKINQWIFRIFPYPTVFFAWNFITLFTLLSYVFVFFFLFVSLTPAMGWQMAVE